MNIKNISVAIVALSFAGAALAAGSDTNQGNAPGKTRAEVIAELQQARARGELVVGDDYPGPFTEPVSTKTRAQVIEELKQARARGEVEVEDYNPTAFLIATPSTLTRAEVRAELKQYQQEHGNRGYADTTFLR